MQINFPRWVVGQEKAASDPYNVINYGIGGQIEVRQELFAFCTIHAVQLPMYIKTNGVYTMQQ